MAIEDNGLERLQRETNEALGRLVLELRESRQGTATRQDDAPEAQPLRDMTDALGGTTAAVRDLTDGFGSNAGALRSAAEAFSSGTQGLLASLANGLTEGGGFGSILRGGFGLAPLAGALAGLFRGGEREEEPVYETVTPPPAIQLEAATSSGRALRSVSRGSGEEVRVVQPRAAAPQVVVNVSAMDSQSFLNRSHDIARAVRDAMLHMDPLNDVIGEL